MTTRVTILTGGISPERDVALASATRVVSALRDRGFDVTVVDIARGPVDAETLTGVVPRDPPTPEQLDALRTTALGTRVIELPEVRNADLVFPVLHGFEGEGGQLQALLDWAGIPYTGSDALGSAIAMAKDVAKRLFRDAGIPTPPWEMWPISDGALDTLGLPVIVKPSRVGSTVGLSVVAQAEDVPAAVELAMRYDSDVLVERLVRGRELTVGVLQDRALAVGEIKPAHDIFDYECKYTPGMCEEVFPADVSDVTAARARELAVRVHHTLKLRDTSRVDFILTPDDELYCLEANTLPGLTGTSLLPQSAAAAGISMEDLCEEICRAALARGGGTNTSS